MLNKADPKEYNSQDEPSEISYKFPVAGESYAGLCVNVNGSGMLLRIGQFIESGKALEVTIDRKTALTASMIAYVEVIRSNEVAPDVYEVATAIKGIKEHSMYG